jgi:hypothetical protein
MNLTDQLFKYVGEFVFVGGGGAAVAFALFQYLGKGWIENRFAERLESFKHQQVLELQRLRVEIESMLSGALKLQDLEFNVLPEAWKRLDEAYGLARWITSAVQQYAAVEKATDIEFEEILQKTLPDLRDSQRTTLLAAQPRERQRQYEKLITWKRYNRALKAINDLDAYIASKGLFLPAALKERFREIIPVIRSSLISVETSLEFEDYKMRRGAGTDLATVEPLFKAIENAVGERLQSHARK